MNQLRTCACLPCACLLGACLLGALLLTGCTAAAAAERATAYPPRATGHVTGRLVMEGGPISPSGKQPGERPIPGTVTFTAAGHRPVSVKAGTSGKFSAWLQPARYRVTGRSPDLLTVTASGKDEELPCSQPQSVTVTTRHAVTIAVVCIVP
jgi:hypothetical protein